MELVIHGGRYRVLVLKFLLSSVIDVILLCQNHARLSVIVFRTKIAALGSVADPDPGSGAFLTPGSGIRDG